jgi:hypothetical protein
LELENLEKKASLRTFGGNAASSHLSPRGTTTGHA